MQETVVGTGSDVKFIGSETRMTQENWQKYFSAITKNGVVKGFETVITQGAVRITDGTVVVNGLVVDVVTDNGYTSASLPSADEIDTLFCVRVYLQTQKVEIVRKTGVAVANNATACAYALKNMILDESYYCDRTDDHYDIAIGYINYVVDTSNAVDTRRFVETPTGTAGLLTDLRGFCIYEARGTSTTYWINPFNLPEDVTIFTQSGKTISISKYFYLAKGTAYNTNVAPSLYSEIPITLFCRSADFSDTSTAKQHTAAADYEMIRLTRFKKAGEGSGSVTYKDSIESYYLTVTA